MGNIIAAGPECERVHEPWDLVVHDQWWQILNAISRNTGTSNPIYHIDIEHPWVVENSPGRVCMAGVFGHVFCSGLSSDQIQHEKLAINIRGFHRGGTSIAGWFHGKTYWNGWLWRYSPVDWKKGSVFSRTDVYRWTPTTYPVPIIIAGIKMDVYPPTYRFSLIHQQISKNCRRTDGVDLKSPSSHKNGHSDYQWPFQEPKLEVPTIYKAYLLGLNFREYPHKTWPKIWYERTSICWILKFPLRLWSQIIFSSWLPGDV